MAPWIWAGLDRASGVAGSGGASDGALSGIWRDAHAVLARGGPRRHDRGIHTIGSGAMSNGHGA